MLHQFSLLAKRRFAPLFITQFFGAFNDNAFKNAFLIWYTYDVAVKENALLPADMMVPLAAALFILPYFFCSGLAGQVADKYQRASLARILKLVEIGLMLACAIGFLLGNALLLLVLLCLMGAQSAMFSPVKYSLLPAHLPTTELVAGNGLVEAGTFLAILIGTIAGGLVIRMEHGEWWLCAGLVACALIGWLASRFIPDAPIRDNTIKVNWHIFRQAALMIRAARQQPLSWVAIIGISWFWFVGVMFLTQLPLYTASVIGGNEQVVTFFLTIFSVGIAIGSMLCNMLMRGQIHGRLIPIGSALMVLSIFLFLIASQDYPLAGAEYRTFAEFWDIGRQSVFITLTLALLSVAAGLYIVPLYAILQHYSDSQAISRMIAVNNMVNALYMVAASLFAMLVYAMGLDIFALFALTALLMAAAGLWLGKRLKQI